MTVSPYFEQDGVTLYHGDCREILPQLGQFDLLLTDPPYGVKRPSQRTADIVGKIEDIHGNSEVDTAWIESIRLSDGGAAYVFTAWEVLEHFKAALAARWNLRSCIVWDKCQPGMADVKTCWAPQYELCLFAGVGRHELQGKRRPDVLRVPRIPQQDRNGHPYEKPVDLLRVILTTSHAKTILDPFAGSGTTLLAARLEGRQAVGIEISERYCEIAANRLRQKLLF